MQNSVGVRRWYVDVSSWQPGSADWDCAMRQLPVHEQQKVMRFLFAKDQRLALGSRLLQRRLVHELFNVPALQIDIQRTPEGKPFWRRHNQQSTAGGGSDGPPETWNFNVSHHGTVVAIASHPHRLVGVDVVQISERPGSSSTTSIDGFFRAFESHFNASEWTYIRSDSSSSSSSSSSADDQYKRFYQLWSLKEAYIKAVGIGLGFDLLRAEFAFDDAQQQWQLTLDGRLASDWCFESMQLDAAHLVSVGLGPLDAMWSPATSSIFLSPSAAFSSTSAFDDEGVETADSTWEQKELADLTV